MGARRIFVSYAAEQRALAESTALSLRGRGYTVYLDRDLLKPAGSYDPELQRAVQDCDVFVFLISPASVEAGRYTLTELKFAREKWPDPRGRILPVIVENTAFGAIPQYLKSVNILEPQGNVAAEISAAVYGMTPRPTSNGRKRWIVGGLVGVSALLAITSLPLLPMPAGVMSMLSWKRTSVGPPEGNQHLHDGVFIPKDGDPAAKARQQEIRADVPDGEQRGAPAQVRTARDDSRMPPPLPPRASPTPPRTVVEATPAPDQRFHVVPVFYGTDRARAAGGQRVAYSADRGKRLELGRALVSVPLNVHLAKIERPRPFTLPWVGTISIEKEDPRRHFTVREIRTLANAEFVDLVRQRLAASDSFRNQSLVFVHGYNTSFDNSLFRTAQISYDMQFDGAVYTYSWPSGAGLASYVYDRDSADGAERYLQEFLQFVQSQTGTSSINIIAHSMGNQMVLRVLRLLKRRTPDAVSRLNQLILVSPDMDSDAFEAVVSEIRGAAKGITLYASANDRALQTSSIVAGGKGRAGDVPAEGPLVVAGVDTIDISNLSTNHLALNHSGYAERNELATDIERLLRSGARPEQRLPSYKRITAPAGTYWRYEN